VETSLRVILILVALLIIAGIIWDAVRVKESDPSRRKPRLLKTQPVHSNQADHPVYGAPDQGARDVHDMHEIKDISDDSLEEDLTVRTRPKPEAPLKPLVADNTAVRFDPTTIIVLNVLARQPGIFSGKKLMDVFKDAHLFHGDMDIYHRYENTDGTGKIMFSIVSAVEPGVFDLTKMDTFITPGLTLFFSSVRPNQSIAAFELMLRTAKLIALRLDGELKDQNRHTLTLQKIERYRERIRMPQLLKKAY
jgi:cell division protein ZipA